MVLLWLLASRVKEEVEHGDVALVQQGALEQEPTEGGVKRRLGHRDHLEAVGEEEGDDGWDRLTGLTVDAVSRVGEDDEDFLLLAEADSLGTGEK